MDPVSQAVTGAALAGIFAPKEKLRAALGIGALAGMAPDLDIFIRSSVDSLMAIEYHRHFTHGIGFIPVGALLCALFFYLFPLVRRNVSFWQCYLYAFLGFATHGLLDATTGYGTRLFWPFSQERISWNMIAVVDIFYTIPALILLIYAARKQVPKAALVAMGWMLAYLGLGWYQERAVRQEAYQWAATKSEEVRMLTVRPTISNLWVWRVVYRDGNTWHMASIFKPLWPGGVTRIFAGESAARFPQGDPSFGYEPDSQVSKDIARFHYFSDGYLGYFEDAEGRPLYGDVRYGMLPYSATPLWAIRIPKDCASCHVDFVTIPRHVDWQPTWDALFGEAPTLEQLRGKVLAVQP